MKVHTNNLETRSANTEATISCCAPTVTNTTVSSDPCCEQPTDGTSCCDKTASQEVNSEKTGCC